MQGAHNRNGELKCEAQAQAHTLSFFFLCKHGERERKRDGMSELYSVSSEKSKNDISSSLSRSLAWFLLNCSHLTIVSAHNEVWEIYGRVDITQARTPRKQRQRMETTRKFWFSARYDYAAVSFFLRAAQPFIVVLGSCFVPMTVSRKCFSRFSLAFRPVCNDVMTMRLDGLLKPFLYIYATHTDYGQCYNCARPPACSIMYWPLDVDCRQFLMLSVFLCFVLRDYVIICLYFYGVCVCVIHFFFIFVVSFISSSLQSWAQRMWQLFRTCT